MRPDNDNPLLISYYTLRRAVGVIGIALPFVLAIGKFIADGPGLQGSVSSYYYTSMRDVFVGGLCAIAVFLYAYKGYDRRDQVAGNLAGLAALGVALVPTTPERDPTDLAQRIGVLHLISAAVFFLTLAYFSLKLFTQMSEERAPTPQKLKRNVVYQVCGITILGCLALIIGVWFLPDDAAIHGWAPVFWLEALAIVAFGVSWLVKGEALLGDKAPGDR